MPGRVHIFVFFFALTFVTSASAYVDPGSTLLLIQGLLAALGAVVVFVKNPIKTIKGWISKIKGRDRA